jgi:hypothetical protein
VLDLTNSIYTQIKAAVTSIYPAAIVQKQNQQTPASFPCVLIDDLGNPEIDRNLSGTGKQSNPSWQIDIYANGSTGEIVAKKIRDAIMPVCENNFFLHRDDSRHTTNVADVTIYRWTLRYSCKVEEEHEYIY